VSFYELKLCIEYEFDSIVTCTKTVGQGELNLVMLNAHCEFCNPLFSSQWLSASLSLSLLASTHQSSFPVPDWGVCGPRWRRKV